MRCKRHTVDLTSNLGGVCASCLRERLLSVAASAAVTENDNNNNYQSRKSNSLIFPRSVSPYVARRKSDAVGGGGGGGVNHRFIVTPQVDTGFSCKDFESNRSSKSKNGKASRLSNLFRARSDDSESRVSCSSSSSSLSWISSFLSKKQPTTTTEDVISNRRPQRVFCRGMSPARDHAEAEDETESSRTPAIKTPGRRKIAAGMGMGFCLSPLVRASPNCPFRRKIRLPTEFNGEVTATEKPHISAAASFCANRSKKLVDIGRVVNHRR